jgi:hypothetical protein
MHIRKKEQDIKDEREKKNKDSGKMCVCYCQASVTSIGFHQLPTAGLIYFETESALCRSQIRKQKRRSGHNPGQHTNVKQEKCTLSK